MKEKIPKLVKFIVTNQLPFGKSLLKPPSAYKMPDTKTQKITQSTERFFHNILHLMVDVGQEIFAFLSRQQARELAR